jgi:predicted dehydrogenase
VTRVAIVGLGAISFEHLAKLRGIPDARVVGVCDLSETLAAAVAERFGVGPPFTDYEEMLYRSRPEVVHVLTPPQSHPPLVRGAVEAGAHAFVEKPIASTWQEYAEMRDAASQRGLMLCEDYTYRFAPVVERALADVEDGGLGEAISVEVTYGGVMGRGGAYGETEIVHFAHALPGGALQNFISHPVSVAVAFMDRVEGVSAWRRRLDADFASDDELRALISGPRTCAWVGVSSHGPPHFAARVIGTRAIAEIDVLAETYHRRAGGHALAAATRRGAEGFAEAASWTARTLAGRRDPYFEGLRILLERFYAAVRDGGPAPVPVPYMDAVNAVIRDIFASGGDG